MALLDFLIVGLAAWRLASFIVQQDGPFDVFLSIRDLLIPEGEVAGFLPKLFSCVWCMSIWTALISYLIWLVWPIPLIILAASSLAIVVDRVAR
jgi:hypothetical protein